MAAKVAIAIRQAEALSRIQAAVATLSARFELPAVELAPQQRDPDMARALQLEGVATLLDELIVKTQPAPEPAKTRAPVSKQAGGER
jgi:hypothetical protein